MKNTFVAAAIVASMCLAACQSNPKAAGEQAETTADAQNTQTDVPFTIAKNYFVNNTVTSLDNPKIETPEQFSEIFGMATTMGPEGKPTAIDFASQYVIAVLVPETNLSTSIEPVSLQKDADGSLTLKYRVTVGEARSYTIQPFFAIVVDRTENGMLTVERVE